MSDMPIQRTNKKVPFALLSEAAAKKNHGQTLARLAERGGMGEREIVALAKKLSWPDVVKQFSESYSFGFVDGMIHVCSLGGKKALDELDAKDKKLAEYEAAACAVVRFCLMSADGEFFAIPAEKVSRFQELVEASGGEWMDHPDESAADELAAATAFAREFDQYHIGDLETLTFERPGTAAQPSTEKGQDDE